MCVTSTIVTDAVDDSLGSQSLFITGDKLGQLRATKEVCILYSMCCSVCCQFVSIYCMA